MAVKMGDYYHIQPTNLLTTYMTTTELLGKMLEGLGC
jgi:hypothetical protein